MLNRMQLIMNERFKQVYEFLKKERFIINQNEFADKIGVSGHQYISLLLNERKNTTENIINKICSAFPQISRKWFLTGTGEMINKKDEVVKVEYDKFVKVPLVSKYAYAGYLLGYGDDEYIGTLPTVEYAPESEMMGNYLAFEVKGDSMDDGSIDGYKEGEILICREIDKYLYKDCQLPINKRDFVIAHKEGLLIKQIINHNIKDHTITIHSLNPIYNDKILDLCDIYKIFSVVESRRQRKR